MTHTESSRNLNRGDWSFQTLFYNFNIVFGGGKARGHNDFFLPVHLQVHSSWIHLPNSMRSDQREEILKLSAWIISQLPHSCYTTFCLLNENWHLHRGNSSFWAHTQSKKGSGQCLLLPLNLGCLSYRSYSEHFFMNIKYFQHWKFLN